MNHHHTRLLIIGAGPYGLALSRWAHRHGVEHMIVGKTMESWKAHMPAGMHLRSGIDWHLDPENELTIVAWLREQGLRETGALPISLETYLQYVDWFVTRSGITVEPDYVAHMDALHPAGFLARLQSGDLIEAESVVVTSGFHYFAVIPPDLKAQFGREHILHTRDFVQFQNAAQTRYLIVGGRQSAFEWGALLAESGARSVDIVHRHPSPLFQEADWSWVGPLLDASIDQPGWFRHLPKAGQKELEQRLWAEGRLKVEPWLKPRLESAPVTVRPNTSVASVHRLSDGSLRVSLTDGSAIEVDQVVAATGYVPDVSRVSFLASSNMLRRMQIRDAVPVLDHHFQTSIPGGYMTSMIAVRDFGPFFAFTVAARASAIIIGRQIANTN